MTFLQVSGLSRATSARLYPAVHSALHLLSTQIGHSSPAHPQACPPAKRARTPVLVDARSGPHLASFTRGLRGVRSSHAGEGVAGTGRPGGLDLSAAPSVPWR